MMLIWFLVVWVWFEFGFLGGVVGYELMRLDSGGLVSVLPGGF